MRAPSASDARGLRNHAAVLENPPLALEHLARSSVDTFPDPVKAELLRTQTDAVSLKPNPSWSLANVREHAGRDLKNRADQRPSWFG
jgi:hypothetical protein